MNHSLIIKQYNQIAETARGVVKVNSFLGLDYYLNFDSLG